MGRRSNEHATSGDENPRWAGEDGGKFLMIVNFNFSADVDNNVNETSDIIIKF